MVSAWVFVIWGNEKYLVGAIAAAGSLRLVNTQHKIVLVYAHMQLSFKKQLTVFDEIVEVPLLRFRVKPLRTKKQNELYGGFFSETANTKWQCLRLTHYKKIMFVDSDIVFQRNCDFLFSMQAPAATFSNPFSETFSRGGFRNPYGRLEHGALVSPELVHQGLQNGFSAAGSMVLLEPTAGMAKAHISWMSHREPYGNPGSYSAIDEQAICEFYADRGVTWTHIDPIYQAIPWKNNWLPGVDILTQAFALHFYHDKPFETGTGTGWPDTKVFWRIYHQFEAAYPKLAKLVRPLMGHYE